MYRPSYEGIARENIHVAVSDETQVEKLESKRDSYDVPILVMTETCPKCKQADKLLSENDIFHWLMLAIPDSEEAMKLVNEHDISMAPTLIVGDRKYEGLAGVVRYIHEVKGWLVKPE